MEEHNLEKEITLKVQRHFISKIKNLNPEHPLTDTYSLESHEMKIIKFIPSYYCTLRVYTQCKQLTQKNHSPKSSLRHKLTKLITFKLKFVQNIM